MVSGGPWTQGYFDKEGAKCIVIILSLEGIW